ncbi:MAG: bifunctional nuclease family protein [Halobacteriota archaeon]|nr:bifunctional nuclease family protein [Halobacteriota archaeon]
MVGRGKGQTPVVFLSDENDNIVPIYVGIAEAISINGALRKETTPRPMTHDLMVSILDSLEAKITKILIDDIDDGVYYARLFIQYNASTKELDARPSDCLALALRTDVSVFVSEDVFEKVSMKKDDFEQLREEGFTTI